MSLNIRPSKEELLLHSNPLTKEDLLHYVVLGRSPVLCRHHKESSYAYAPSRFFNGSLEMFLESASQGGLWKYREIITIKDFIDSTIKYCDVFIHPEQEIFK